MASSLQLQTQCRLDFGRSWWETMEIDGSLHAQHTWRQRGSHSYVRPWFHCGGEVRRVTSAAHDQLRLLAKGPSVTQRSSPHSRHALSNETLEAPPFSNFRYVVSIYAPNGEVGLVDLPRSPYRAVPICAAAGGSPKTVEVPPPMPLRCVCIKPNMVL